MSKNDPFLKELEKIENRLKLLSENKNNISEVLEISKRIDEMIKIHLDNANNNTYH